MKPICHPKFTRLVTPAQIGIKDTATPCGNPVMESTWLPTLEELAILNAGGVVKLSIMGAQNADHPFVAVNAHDLALL